MSNKKENDISIEIIFKDAKEANLRLQKALEMLVSKNDIINYFKTEVSENNAQKVEHKDAKIIK